MHQLLGFSIRQIFFGFLILFYLAKAVGDVLDVLNRSFGVNAAINEDLRRLTSNATNTNTNMAS